MTHCLSIHLGVDCSSSFFSPYLSALYGFPHSNNKMLVVETPAGPVDSCRGYKVPVPDPSTPWFPGPAGVRPSVHPCVLDPRLTAKHPDHSPPEEAPRPMVYHLLHKSQQRLAGCATTAQRILSNSDTSEETRAPPPDRSREMVNLPQVRSS